MKSGIKTTEFWKSVAVYVVGAVIIAVGMSKGSDTLISVGGLLLGGTASAYSLSRGLAKSKQSSGAA